MTTAQMCVNRSYFETGFYSVAQAGPKLSAILLPQAPDFSDYRFPSMLPRAVYASMASHYNPERCHLGILQGGVGKVTAGEPGADEEVSLAPCGGLLMLLSCERNFSPPSPSS